MIYICKVKINIDDLTVCLYQAH